MDKPTIELIRFDASDVIATSGNSMPLDGNFDGTDAPGEISYIMTGREYAQYAKDYGISLDSVSDWYIQPWNSYNFTGMTADEVRSEYNDRFMSYTYAWYNTTRKSIVTHFSGISNYNVDFDNPFSNPNLPY